MIRNCSIKINELPPRAQELNKEELKKIFGGTGGHCERCICDMDCREKYLFCIKDINNGRTYCLQWGEDPYECD